MFALISSRSGSQCYDAQVSVTGHHGPLVFSLFCFPQKIGFEGDSLYEMSKPVFWGKVRKIF